jgi:hypothetical protein
MSKEEIEEWKKQQAALKEEGKSEEAVDEPSLVVSEEP